VRSAVAAERDQQRGAVRPTRSSAGSPHPGRTIGDHWRVEIADNGRGIPAGRREEAFSLLAQVHPHGTVEGGFGIGLATCRRIVNAHGGSISISDGIDGGVAVVVHPRGDLSRPDC
jgi:signal transduction histidine kinase